MQFYHPQGWERWIGVVFWIAVAFVFIDYIRTLLTLRKRKEISPATATSVLNSPFRKGNRYGKRPSTPDVVWHVAFSARVGHGLTRATFHQHAHGGLRAPGRCDERHFSGCVGRNLDRSETAAAGKNGSVLDCALRHLHELGNHHI